MGSYLHTWYRWNLGNDFLLMLNKFGRLPLELPIDKLINSLNLKKDFKADVFLAKVQNDLVMRVKDEKIRRLE